MAIDCADPDGLAAFWCEVLGYRVADPPPGHSTWSDYSRAVAEEPDEAWSRIVNPEGVGGDYYAVMHDPEGNEFRVG